MLKTSNTRKRKTKLTSSAYNIMKADPTFGISPIVNSYRIDLAHALFRATMQPVFREEMLSGKMQTVNSLCAKTQMLLQTYCLQQFVFTSMAQHILTMIMKAANKKAKPMDKNAHEMFMEAFRALKTLGGGGGGKKTFSSVIKKSIVFLLLLFYCVTATSGNSNSLSTINTQFSALSKGPSEAETISLQLYEMKQTESVAVSVKNAIDRHDAKLEEQISGIGNTLYYLFHSFPASGEEQIIKYVEEFNDVMADYSKKATKDCRKIVEDAYTNGMFANYKTKEQIDMLESEYEMLSHMKQKNKEETTTSFKQTIASAAAAAFSGDVLTPFAMMYKTVESASNRPGDKLEDMGSTMRQETGITAEQLLQTSKVYCANSFHIELEYSEEEKTLKLLGDKIGYQSMRDFTSSVILNMKAIQKTTATNKDTELIYKSMEQRMGTLEYIINHMESMVTMGMMNELGIRTKARSVNPISKIRDYFDEQKQIMDAAIATMGEMFPVDERIQREQMLANQEMARLAAKQTESHAKINAEYYVSMINTYSELVRKPLAATVSNFVATVLEIPAGTIETTTEKLSSMFTNMIGIMMKSSGGIVILSFSTMLFIVLMGMALNTVKMAASMLYVPFIPFIWVLRFGVNAGSATLKTMGLIRSAPAQEKLMLENTAAAPASTAVTTKKISGNKTRKLEQNMIVL